MLPIFLYPQLLYYSHSHHHILLGAISTSSSYALNLLHNIKALNNLTEVAIAVARIHTAAGNPLFSMGVSADLLNSNINALYAEQSGLGMGNRDYYFGDENEAKRKGYTEWLKKAFEIYGAEDAAAMAEDVMAFETKMAEKFRSNVELRDVPANYNPTTRGEFVKKYLNIKIIGGRIYVERELLEDLLKDTEHEQFPLS